MNLIRKDKTQAALQKTYEDAYQASLQAIILETQNDRDAALESWNSTLNSISLNMSKFDGKTPKSASHQGLMSSILDIERQCHDRISFLESRRYPSTNPYMNSYSTSSSTLNDGSSSTANHKKSVSEIGSYSSSSVLTVPRKNLPSKSDPLIPHQPKPLSAQLIAMNAHHRSYSGSSTPPYYTTAPSSSTTSPSYQSHSSQPLSTSSQPPQPPPHRTNASSSSTLVPTQTTPTLRAKSSADLAPVGVKSAPKSMMKTLRSSGRSGKLAYGQRGGTSSASTAATLAWGTDSRPSTAPNASSRTVPSNGSSKSYATGGTTIATATKSSRPATSAPSLPRSQPSLLDEPLIDFTSDTIQPTRTKSQPAIQQQAVKKSYTPPLIAPIAHKYPIPSTGVRRQSPTQKQPTRSSPAPPSSNSHLAPSNKLSAQQAVLKRSMASNAISSTTAQKPVTGTNKTGPKPKVGPKPKAGPKPKTAGTAGSAGSNSTAKTEESTPETEWDKMAKEKIKGIRGIDENAANQILNEIVLKGDEVHWEDIAGLEQAKTSLKEAVVYPFLRPDLFSGLREPARGMLLFGPPGTGKTMLARAVATESNSTFFAISASSLTSKFLGESEKLVRALFQMARAFAPSIIFVDEIDSLLATRSENGEHEASRRIKNEFLVQWSDLQHAAAGRDNGDDLERVLVLAATNLPWGIDEAARRRFVRRQYIPLPERETRAAHLQKLLSNQKHALTEADFQKLVDLTDGFSGSDMTALAKDAAMGPLRSLGEALLTTPRDQIRPMGIEDFVSSLRTIRPSVSKEGLKAFEDWAALYGSSGA
ncbi:putative AAA family ATPase SAP1 [Sugiyamaella lignohabitans]|uniref:Putative AAA family ATPase SAP1 n=1 Tax=Sugiyamaella lignohabitans TaxID=796027 RepID=A0A161HHI6_9ASCO|nr:putative AAA family ATPase SAP1 [Sugiyamaella lignohabitans]ANB15500.1 putative AAA family ATPase SAP1 [Sugiyamaella lignohabitans]